MSEKEFSEGEKVPRVQEHLDEEAAPGNDAEGEIEEAAPGNDAEGEIEEAREAEEIRPLETESRDSGHDSPLEGATGGSRDSGHGSALEGATGGVPEDDYGVTFSSRERRRIKSGKEDIFRKFFSKEYDQALAPILDRHRHSARRQRVRTRHTSEPSGLPDPNPLGCLQDAGTSSGAVLNQAGAIIGKTIPREEIPEYARFGTEFGQSLPLTARREGSERSLSSIGTALIGEIYGGTFSRPPSDDSRGLSPGSSFPSFSSRPPTAASDTMKTSPPLDSASPEGDKRMSPTPADSENVAQKNPPRQRRLGVVSRPLPIRSKSALAGSLEYCTEDSDQERKVSKDMSVCSEPLPQRKISKDSSVDYNDLANLEEDAVIYPELSHSVESVGCLPMPDINPAAVEDLQNLDALKVSDVESDAVEQNSVGQEAGESEQDPSIVLSGSPDVDETSQQPPSA